MIFYTMFGNPFSSSRIEIIHPVITQPSRLVNFNSLNDFRIEEGSRPIVFVNLKSLINVKKESTKEDEMEEDIEDNHIVI